MATVERCISRSVDAEVVIRGSLEEECSSHWCREEAMHLGSWILGDRRITYVETGREFESAAEEQWTRLQVGERNDGRT